MNFGTCLDAVFGRFPAVLAARIEPGGSKRGGKNDETGKNTICIIHSKNQARIKISSPATPTFGSKWRAEVAKNEVNLEAQCGSNFASIFGGFWVHSGGQKWSKSGAEK